MIQYSLHGSPSLWQITQFQGFSCPTKASSLTPYASTLEIRQQASQSAAAEPAEQLLTISGQIRSLNWLTAQMLLVGEEYKQK